MLPQTILLAILFLGLGIALSQHGTPKEGDNNFWYTFIGDVIVFGLLYWGGFFDKLIHALFGN